jgi:hypothetical protein
MSKRGNDLMVLLRSALALEFPAFVQVTGNVAGDPVLSLSEDDTPASNEEVAYIKILQKSYTGFPIPSLASTSDGRTHVIQLAYERTAGADITVWTTPHWSQLIARLKDLNCEIELYRKANGNVPVEGDVIAANLVGTIRADIRHPNAGQ